MHGRFHFETFRCLKILLFVKMIYECLYTMFLKLPVSQPDLNKEEVRCQFRKKNYIGCMRTCTRFAITRISWKKFIWKENSLCSILVQGLCRGKCIFRPVRNRRRWVSAYTCVRMIL